MRALKFAAVILLSLFAVFTTAGITGVYIFGQFVGYGDASVVFYGDEISDVPFLIENLKVLPDLKAVDLGSRILEKEEAEELESAFPDVDFTYDRYVDICGVRFVSSDETVDLSEAEFDDTAPLLEALPYMRRLKTVTGGGNAVASEKLEALREAYPNVEFDILAVFDIYGRRIREDARQIDLSGAAVDAELDEKLAVFHDLEKLTLYGTSRTLEEQIATAKRYPSLEVLQKVTIGKKTFDTGDERVDLTGAFDTSDRGYVEDVLSLFLPTDKVELSESDMTNDELAALREKFADNFELVWTLKIGKWFAKTDAVSFSVLVHTLDECRIVKNKDLELLKYFTDLMALDLGHQSVTTVEPIVKYCPNLRILILADSRIKDISPLANLKYLHYLELFWGNKFTDLSPLAECKQLVDLNISYVYTVRDLSPLYDLPMLERLWIEHMYVPAAQVKKLRELYPDATIIDEGEGSIDQGWREHRRYWQMIYMYNHPYYKSEDFFKYDREDI